MDFANYRKKKLSEDLLYACAKHRLLCACALAAAFGLCLRRFCWSVPCSVKAPWNKNRKEKSFGKTGKAFVSCVAAFFKFILS